MEDGSLPSPPLAVGIGHWRVSWEDSANVPPEKIWIVEQGSVVELRIVSDEWSLVSQASSETSAHEEHHPKVSDNATSVERLDGQFTNYGQTQEASQLGSSGVVSPVPVRLLHWSHDHLVSLRVVEPRVKDLQIFLGLVGPEVRTVAPVAMEFLTAPRVANLHKALASRQFLDSKEGVGMPTAKTDSADLSAERQLHHIIL